MKQHLVALAAALGGSLAGPSLAVDGPNLLADVSGTQGAKPPAPWRFVGLPIQSKPLTRFQVTTVAGARVLEIKADESYGNLVHDVSGAASSARSLSWRWRIEQGNLAGDPHERSGDDHALAVCAMFDLPLSAMSFGERQALRAARLTSGEDLPSATLCYSWDERLPQGTVIVSPFTHYVRYLVLRGSGEPLQQWRPEQRDLHADFLRLFGADASTVPPLLAVAVLADTDNTHGHSLALLSELVLK
jgi:hypothetical protein